MAPMIHGLILNTHVAKIIALVTPHSYDSRHSGKDQRPSVILEKCWINRDYLQFILKYADVFSQRPSITVFPANIFMPEKLICSCTLLSLHFYNLQKHHHYHHNPGLAAAAASAWPAWLKSAASLLRCMLERLSMQLHAGTD